MLVQMALFHSMLWLSNILLGFPCGTVVKNPPASSGDTRDVGLIPELGKFPGVGNGNPTPVPFPGESSWTEEPGRL